MIETKEYILNQYEGQWLKKQDNMLPDSDH